MSWIQVSKGNALPAGAILAGSTPSDGVLYIGRASSGEVGKYNVSTGAPGGNVHNLWTHAGGCHSSGQILVCSSDQVASWEPYSKGNPLPQDAFHAGFFESDGALYVGRLAANGEVGKLNVDSGVPGGKMHNLWCHGAGRKTSGQILCIKEKPIKWTAKLTPIIMMKGGGSPDSYFDEEHEIEVGSSDETFNQTTMTKIQAKVSGSINTMKFSAQAEMNSQINSSISSTLSKTSRREKVKKKFHIRMDQPTYIYTAELSVEGGPVLKSDVLVQTSEPLVETTFGTLC